MKSIVKYSILLGLALAALAGCKRFDPEDRIITSLDLPQCMKPVSIDIDVLYNTVTLDLKVFPDAEKYLFELYSSTIYEDTEPSPEDLVSRLEIDPGDIPFTFTTLEETTLYYRLAATNESKGKKQSFWAVGRFKTSVDPTHICLTPDPKVTTEYDNIRFSWQKVLTDKYLLEIYNSPIPTSGDPDAADLYKSVELTNDDIPYTLKVPARESNYYYRVKAIDLAGERFDSKWATGSFLSQEFAWPTDENAFDYGLEPGASKVAKMDAELFEAKGVALNASFIAPIVIDGITWMAKDGNSGQYKGDRVTYNRRKSWETLSDGTKVAADIGIRLSILRPGTFRIFPRIAISSKVWEGSEQKFTAVLAVSKSGEISASKILETTPTVVSKNSSDQNDDAYCIIFTVTEEMLYGMDAPATLYLYHEANNSGNIGLQLDYYAPKWTSAL